MKPHPLNEAYFFEGAPKLFHAPDGRYMIGLVELFGAHRCWKPVTGKPEGEDADHDFINNKCTRCGIQRKPYRYLID
jgi:hypothetical protein